MVLALSLQTDIKSVGAYAGFASIVGLALLVLLYFAQAREMRRLSELMHEQEERLRRLPAAPVATAARPVVLPTPAAPPRPAGPAPTAVAATAPPTATVAVPGARRVAVAAAGQPATAVAAATTPAPLGPATAAGALADAPAVPDPSLPPAPGAITPRRVPLEQTAAGAQPVESDAETIVKPAGAMPLVARAAATAEPTSGAPADGEDKEARDGPDTSETAVVAIPPDPEASERPESNAVTAVPPRPAAEEEEAARTATVPANARRVATPYTPPREDSPVLAPATAAGATGLGALAGAAAGERTRFPPPPPTPAGRGAPAGVTERLSGRGAATMRRERPADEDGEGASHGGLSGSTLRLAIVAVVLVGVIIFVASQVLGGGSSKPPPTTTTNANTAPPPASVTVAVLNGTLQSGLATRVSQTLVSEGFRRGAIANAPSQHHISTVVAYTPGHRDAANEVAQDLALTTTQVVPADAATVAAASHQGTTPTVVVTLGSNYAQQ